jgi:cation transport ATPase
VLVTFGRVAGSSVQVDATGEELLAVAAELEARGRHPLAERL